MIPKPFYRLFGQPCNEGMSPKGGMPLMRLLVSILFFIINLEGVASYV